MSFGRPGNFSDSFNVAPPEKGSFPLDHDHDCSPVMKRYLACLRTNKQRNEKCRDISKEYLQCRFDHGLMEKADWPSLGFPESSPDLSHQPVVVTSKTDPSSTPLSATPSGPTPVGPHPDGASCGSMVASSNSVKVSAQEAMPMEPTPTNRIPNGIPAELGKSRG